MVRGLLTPRGVVVLLLHLSIVLGSCAGLDAHPPDTGDDQERCDVQPIGIKAGVERQSSVDRAVPVVTPALPDTTVVWHCGTPDTSSPVLTVDSLSILRHAPRAPPRG